MKGLCIALVSLYDSGLVIIASCWIAAAANLSLKKMVDFNNGSGYQSCNNDTTT
jgi:hypothetical protein